MKYLIPGYRIYSVWELIAVLSLDIISSMLLLPIKVLHLIRRKALNDFSVDGIKRILLFRTDRMGDLIMTMPAFETLRKFYPDAKIDLITVAWNRSIAEKLDCFDNTHYWNPSWVSRGEGISSFLTLCVSAWNLRRIKYDLAIDFTSDVRINLLMLLTGAQRRVGYTDGGGRAFLTTRVPENDIHRVDQNMLLLEKIGVVEEKKYVSLGGILRMPEICGRYMTDFRKEHSIKKAGKWIIVHPWGGRKVKTWSVSGYARLIEELVKKYDDYTIFISGSKNDYEFCNEVTALTDKGINISGTLSLEEMICVLKETALFISPDTGPMHLAVALGTKTLTLFGPSDITKYAPYGDKKRHSVVVARDYDCLHCNRIRKPPKKCFKDGVAECMRRISIDDCMNEINKLLR